MKTRILFVCLGNICRSPAAEGILKAMVREEGREADFLIDSAAIGPWHVGQLPDPRMRRCGRRHGYQFDSRARQVSAADFDRFDMIMAMDDENYAALSRMAPTDEARRKIHKMSALLSAHPGVKAVPDPYYGNDSDFDWAVELLEDACRMLLSRIPKKLV